MDFFNISTHKEKVKLSAIVFDKEIYPREHQEHDQNLVSKYIKDIEVIEAASNIYLSSDYSLLDGRHRQLAFETVYGKDYEIEVLIFETTDTKEKYALSNFHNSQSGCQLSQQAKRANAITMYSKYEFTQEEIAKSLSTRKSNVSKWLTTILAKEKEERDHKVFEMYLRAWNTQQSIADMMGIGIATVNETIKKFEKVPGNYSEQNFNPFLYNIWNTPKQDNSVSYFGAFPEIFMENLLWYHTNQMDIVYDPFGGGGTTVDVCKRMLRRYYVSDRKVMPGRENDIREHDIKNGLPEDLQKPNLVFIDPPYWKQAHNKYSDSSEDLGNMSLDDFNTSMKNLIDECISRKIEQIAIVIQPTQYSNDFIWTDHIFDFDKMMSDKYRIDIRYILPYSTQQYNAQMVDKSKEINKCLCLNRDLVVWRYNK
jgi:hypothetical protein